MRDWTGNASVRNCNLRRMDAEPNDYYATEPRATELLLEQEQFAPTIWEPACGEGHIAEVLKANGYSVTATDLVDRGYGSGDVDFLQVPAHGNADVDIITNPPYKFAKDFVEHALAVVSDGRKVAMFLKLTFLEGQSRRELFRNNPPKTVYVASGRLQCGKNGDFSGTSMVAYAWFVWEKGYPGPIIVKHIN